MLIDIIKYVSFFVILATTSVFADGYKRNEFMSSWSDLDGNCLNTRHDLLAKLSTTDPTIEDCKVIHGRWIDPYSGKVFTNPKALDIDHVVSLKYAWEHGADKWTKAERKTFANDERNLFAVNARDNRQKQDKAPDVWLPPDETFVCQYILRFIRVSFIYKLEVEPKIYGLAAIKCIDRRK